MASEGPPLEQTRPLPGALDSSLEALISIGFLPRDEASGPSAHYMPDVHCLTYNKLNPSSRQGHTSRLAVRWDTGVGVEGGVARAPSSGGLQAREAPPGLGGAWRTSVGAEQVGGSNFKLRLKRKRTTFRSIFFWRFSLFTK